ncbi:hyaluronan mediated motility receptor-like isoform X2 [Aphidius gifuensis]|uniref:hyaluronan mediated motility receptor-like isoform X2 n=1 Tax=Aphidius gifuensis TaxID=684658 RepID=UPI001CDC57A8|nr:hyaluronan mediated motility receptor-like isoform X2 [Aphidius gifuensis]
MRMREFLKMATLLRHNNKDGSMKKREKRQPADGTIIIVILIERIVKLIIMASATEASTATLSSGIFESLGTIESLNNGMPKFRLGEPAFSMDHMSPSYLSSSNVNCDDQETSSSSSFVVLGKSSMEYEAASLADYQKIQQKSMAIDCPSSLLSTMTHLEIENKVTELMQENLKLKETLLQNNVKMKQQFNTLVSWQDELKSLTENHKKKFTENRNIIELLKNENADLRIKILKIDPPKCESSLEEKTSMISSESVNISLPIESIKYDDDDDDELKNKSYQRDIHYLQEINESLKKQLAILSDKLLTDPPLEINHENLTDTEHYQRYISNLNNYQKMIDSLGKSYAIQTSRYVDIQNSLKQAIDSLEYCDAIRRSTLDEKMQSTLKILQDSRSQLINEQLKNIKDRQIFINIHNQFKKILSDYNVVLDELNILGDEKSKLIEEQIISKIRQQSNDLERDKINIHQAKCQFEEEKKIFVAEKQLFELNKESLEGEKASIDLQSQLYEVEMKILQDNAKILEKRQDHLQAEISSLKLNIQMKEQKIQSQVDEIQSLRAQVECYKCDFEDETKARKFLLQDREKLTAELAKSNAYKQELLQKLNGQNYQQVATDRDD